MKTIPVAALAIATTLVVAQPTAQARAYEIETGVFIGAHIYSDSNALGRYKGDSIDNAFSPGAAFGLRIGYGVHPRLMLEAELGLMPTGTKEGRTQVFAFGWRGNILVHLLTGRVRPFILVGGGGFTNTSSNPNIVAPDTDGEVHAGVGIKIDVKRNWGIRLDGRVQFSPAISGIYFTEDGEVTAAIYGLFDFGRKAVAAAPPVGSFVPPPPPPRDSDGDGVIDENDRCPREPGLAELGGCPDRDGDGDGIVDRLDKCPTVAGLEVNMGCPDTDGDNDGIVDRLDKCPAEAGPAANGGCPDTDADKDGIVDRLDKCPAAAETKNGWQDEDGCPDELPPAVKPLNGPLAGVTFVKGKTALVKGSATALDKIAAVLKEHAALKLEIQVYAENAALSQTRADALKAYLVGKGIDGARLTAKGMGVDPAKRAVGRLELKLL